MAFYFVLMYYVLYTIIDQWAVTLLRTKCLDTDSLFLFCVLKTWIHFFYTLTYLWTLIYCIDCLASVYSVHGSMSLYHHFTWPVATVLSAIGLLSLYAPDMACHNSDANPYIRFLPNYMSTAVPLVIILCICPLLYCITAHRLRSVVAGMSGRYTLSERTLVAGIRRRFSSCVLCFMCVGCPMSSMLLSLDYVEFFVH